ncbi:hypothetical protein QZH41_019735 [Actinostola sp. cb2023]|nr:hypothetical protein QZH41_019735 [Actinostola sp. cb2023]
MVGSIYSHYLQCLTISRNWIPVEPIQEQTNKLPLCAEWEFPRNRLTIGEVIGSGAFGQVFKSDAVGIVAFDPRSSIKGKGARRRSLFGSARSPYYNNKQVTVVACKGLKEDASQSEYRDLVSELKILMHIGEHKNIVNLLGACTKGREWDILVIIEYCPHGNLHDFLRKQRDLFEPNWAPATEKPDELFTTTDLVITAFQVARAMEFLATRRVTRNVLVGENYVMKVADFGLARDIYKDEHYVKTTPGLLPVKWMAIEALVDRIYTHQSDAWSFGVLLWEIFTLGGSPYPSLPANEVYQYLMEGQRMHQPDDCPDKIEEKRREEKRREEKREKREKERREEKKKREEKRREEKRREEKRREEKREEREEKRRERRERRREREEKRERREEKERREREKRREEKRREEKRREERERERERREKKRREKRREEKRREEKRREEKRREEKRREEKRREEKRREEKRREENCCCIQYHPSTFFKCAFTKCLMFVFIFANRYALMLSCWEHEADSRPFSVYITVQTIDKLLEQKATQTGVEYLELENEVDSGKEQPYYLQPEEINSFQPPRSPGHSPLPPLPSDVIELEQLTRSNGEYQNTYKKDDDVLKNVPNIKIKRNGSAEYELLSEHQKKSDSSSIFVSYDDEQNERESEKDHLMKDCDDKGVF